MKKEKGRRNRKQKGLELRKTRQRVYQTCLGGSDQGKERGGGIRKGFNAGYTTVGAGEKEGRWEAQTPKKVPPVRMGTDMEYVSQWG